MVKGRRGEVVASKMADALAASDSRDFWVEAKKINNSGKPSPSTVDGETGHESIVDVSKYS